MAGDSGMSEDEVKALVAQLRDFRSRSEAIKALVAAGKEAVAPLVEALAAETQEGARWAILRCLGELRASSAVYHVAPLLDEPSHRSAAHAALVRIVGEDLGPTPGPWIKWAGEEAAPGESLAPEMHMTGFDDDRLVTLALKDSGASWHEKQTGRLAVDIPLGEGTGAQGVTVDLSRKDHEGSSIVIVYADCGPAASEHYEQALRRNLQMPYGALAVRDGKSGPCFVMFNTLLRDALSPLELKKSILTIAEHAARMKRDMEG
jgi:hypothetical protein